MIMPHQKEAAGFGQRPRPMRIQYDTVCCCSAVQFRGIKLCCVYAAGFPTMYKVNLTLYLGLSQGAQLALVITAVEKPGGKKPTGAGVVVRWAAAGTGRRQAADTSGRYACGQAGHNRK